MMRGVQFCFLLLVVRTSVLDSKCAAHPVGSPPSLQSLVHSETYEGQWETSGLLGPDLTGPRRMLQNLNFGQSSSQREGQAAPQPPPQVLAVRTAQELQLAVVRGQPYIEIRDHLDLGSLPTLAMPGTTLTSLLGSVPPEVLSIQGNCTEPPSPQLLQRASGPTVLPLRGRQCLLLAPADVMYLRSGKLWIKGLYLRAARNTTATTALTLLSVSDPPNSQLWLSESTLQGDGGVSCTGLYAASAAHAQDVTFSHLGSGEPPVNVLLDGTPASFRDCRFVNNTVGPELGVVTASTGNTFVKLENVTFSENSADAELLDSGEGRWYSDEPRAVTIAATAGGGVKRTLPVQQAPLTAGFLEEADPWLSTVQQESASGERAVLVVKPSNSSSHGADLSTGAIIGIAAAALVPMILTAALLIWRCRYMRQVTLSETQESIIKARTASFVMSAHSTHSFPQSFPQSLHSARSMHSARSQLSGHSSRNHHHPHHAHHHSGM